MSTNDHLAGVRRALTPVELDALFTAITDTTSPEQLLHRTIVGVFTPLLADVGKTFKDLTADHRLDPTAYAIPTVQWQAIAGAVTERAAEWGIGPELALQLIDYMPSTYDDPNTPTPAVTHVDRRPHIHQLDVTREATDVIADCNARVQALGTYFGRDSVRYLDALTSWHAQLSRLFGMSFGAKTRVSRDGDLSLLVTTGSGFVFGLVFHGVQRRCTADGCHARIDDDATSHPTYTGAPILDHDHSPSYPLGAPQPGTWSFHS